MESKLASSGLQIDTEHSLNYVSVATQTEGYLATDLHDLVSRAVHQATIRAAGEQSEVRARNYYRLFVMKKMTFCIDFPSTK